MLQYGTTKTVQSICIKPPQQQDINHSYWRRHMIYRLTVVQRIYILALERRALILQALIQPTYRLRRVAHLEQVTQIVQ